MALIAAIIVFNFGALFGLLIEITTVYGQPMLGLCWALLVGWVWSRNKLLEEIKQGYPEIEQGLFWKIWPLYVRIVCPIFMLLVFFA